MNSRRPGSFLLLVMALAATPLCADTAQVKGAEINHERAKFHYQMSCQGCHSGDGTGYNAVPRLKGFVGHFLGSQEGREYLVRVPGSADALLNDEQLTEVLNWILLEFGGDSLGRDWKPFGVEEVAAYRADPLLEVVQHRAQVLDGLSFN